MREPFTCNPDGENQTPYSKAPSEALRKRANGSFSSYHGGVGEFYDPEFHRWYASYILQQRGE